MNKEKLIWATAFVALGLLLLGVPATYLWGPQWGAILRWLGVGVAIVYFVLRSKFRREQE